MNPLLQEAIGSVLRSVLKIGAGYLVARGIWTAEAATSYVAAAALALVGLGWSYWTTYASRLKLVTALASPTKLSEAQVEHKIQQGADLPSPTTPKAAIPSPEPPR